VHVLLSNGCFSRSAVFSHYFLDVADENHDNYQSGSARFRNQTRTQNFPIAKHELFACLGRFVS
jgi:hypothetical protein